MSARVARCLLPGSVFLALSIAVARPFAQDSPQSQFLDIKVSPDELYSYRNLKFVGDFISCESPSGVLALGRTTAGVTLVIIIGAGTVTIEAPEAVREKFAQVLGNYPLKTSFKSIYLRMHPKEFDETIGKTEMTKSTDAAALKRAEELFAERFLTSYHAGPKAILPPPRTRVFDIETTDMGLIANEEGYWITLRRLSPYGSVYPSRFINPKYR